MSNSDKPSWFQRFKNFIGLGKAKSAQAQFKEYPTSTKPKELTKSSIYVGYSELNPAEISRRSELQKRKIKELEPFVKFLEQLEAAQKESSADTSQSKSASTAKTAAANALSTSSVSSGSVESGDSPAKKTPAKKTVKTKSTRATSQSKSSAVKTDAVSATKAKTAAADALSASSASSEAAKSESSSAKKTPAKRTVKTKSTRATSQSKSATVKTDAAAATVAKTDAADALGATSASSEAARAESSPAKKTTAKRTVKSKPTQVTSQSQPEVVKTDAVAATVAKTPVAQSASSKGKDAAKLSQQPKAQGGVSQFSSTGAKSASNSTLVWVENTKAAISGGKSGGTLTSQQKATQQVLKQERTDTSTGVPWATSQPQAAPANGQTSPAATPFGLYAQTSPVAVAAGGYRSVPPAAAPFGGVADDCIFPVRCKEDMQQAINAWMAPWGRLKRNLNYFQYRSGQVAMCQKIGSSLMEAQSQILLLEAGTGLGKTYAYLLPVLLAHKRVIISTGTLYLQHQLVLQDIPQLLSLLGLQNTMSYSLLMGRAHYLCHYKLSLLCNFEKFQQLLIEELHSDQSKAASVRDKQELNTKLVEQYWQLYNQLKVKFSETLRQQGVVQGQVDTLFAQWLQILSTVLDSIESRPNSAASVSTQTADRQLVYWGEIPLFFQQLEKLQQSYALNCPQTFFSNPIQYQDVQFLFSAGAYSQFEHSAAHGTWLNLLGSSLEQCHCESCPYQKRGQCWYQKAQETAQKSHLVVLNHALLTTRFVPRTAIWKMLEQHPTTPDQIDVQLEQSLTLAPNFQDYDSEIYSGEISLHTMFKERDALIIDEAHSFEKALHTGAIQTLTSQGLWWMHSQLSYLAQKGALQAGLSVQSLLMDLLKKLGSLRESKLPGSSKGIALRQLFSFELSSNLSAGRSNLKELLSELALALEQLVDLNRNSIMFQLEDSVKYLLVQATLLSNELRLVLSFDSEQPHNSSANVGLFKLTGEYSLKEDPEKTDTISLRHFEIQIMPVYIESYSYIFFKLLLQAHCLPVFTSATLQIADPSQDGPVERNFNTLKQHLGFMQLPVYEKEFELPFNYARKSLVWSSGKFAQCTFQRGYRQQNLEAVDLKLKIMRPVLDAVLKESGVLILVTSFSTIEVYAQVLQRNFPQALIFKQQEHEALEIPLARYKAAVQNQHPAFMIGTLSCWTGINLPGKLARVVVIDKLAFPMPNGLNKEYEQYLNQATDISYFARSSLPAALVTLKQGIGRLIRTEEDWGVVILAFDFQSKKYASQIYKTLEPMPYLEEDEPSKVLGFIRSHNTPTLFIEDDDVLF